jgi:hypothetical protein
VWRDFSVQGVGTSMGGLRGVGKCGFDLTIKIAESDS